MFASPLTESTLEIFTDMSPPERLPLAISINCSKCILSTNTSSSNSVGSILFVHPIQFFSVLEVNRSAIEKKDTGSHIPMPIVYICTISAFRNNPTRICFSQFGHGSQVLSRLSRSTLQHESPLDFAIF